MNEETLEYYRRAGSVAAQARQYGLGLVKEGVLFVDVANAIEQMIQGQGCGIAFPVNISRNQIAAHYSPRHDDAVVFEKGDVVKIDVGVHIHGYIADTAATVEVGTARYTSLIQASAKALENAITKIREHAPLSDVGKTVEETISSYGYSSVDNLTGHSMTKYLLHAGVSVPNVADKSLATTRLQPGDVVAVEPFASDGAGHVVSGEGSNIYLYQDSMREKLIRDHFAKMTLQNIKNTFSSLPFAQRWCFNKFQQADTMLRKLTFAGSLKHYPQLIDKGNGRVSQAEHTIIITQEGCEVIT